MCLLITVPWYIVGLTYWSALWTAIVSLIIGAEIHAKLTDGKTLTKQFYAWGRDNKPRAILILICLLTAMLLLIAHLAAGL
jgi:4-amino-4-deoxy-L-arabinose transferase-like glycosyltransferase